jgi:hypothetical protein
VEGFKIFGESGCWLRISEAMKSIPGTPGSPRDRILLSKGGDLAQYGNPDLINSKTENPASAFSTDQIIVLVLTIT